MPTKPITRLLFAQGGHCFFCAKPLPADQASVEHLVAKTHGGVDGDENCVATCKTLNSLFGRMSLKEKMKVMLNQKGSFHCPAGSGAAGGQAPAASPSSSPKPRPAARPGTLSHEARLDLVIRNLKSRGNSRPGKLGTLENTISAYLTQIGEKPEGAVQLLQELQAKSLVSVDNQKVSYHLP